MENNIKIEREKKTNTKKVLCFQNITIFNLEFLNQITFFKNQISEYKVVSENWFASKEKRKEVFENKNNKEINTNKILCFQNITIFNLDFLNQIIIFKNQIFEYKVVSEN